MLVVPPTLRPTQRNSDTIAVAQVIARAPWQAARAHIDWNCAVAPARLHASSVFATLAVQSRAGHGHRTVQIDRRPGGDVPTAALAKTDFSAMEALGQFNLGFLVCRLGDHLFLVDQHAADEKFRYEALWRDTRVDTQPLLAPLSLDLGATEELALLERRCTVERVGFRLAVNDLAPPGRRVAVISVPSARGATFGVSDIRELITLLDDDAAHDTPLPKLPKLHTLFASKACRAAVMIGTPLIKTKMTQLLDHLATLLQPWNCPHGRPTTRHLAHVPSLFALHSPAA